MVSNANDDSVIELDDENSSINDSFEKKLLFSLEIAHEEVFTKVKDTVITALKDSLRCIDIHHTIIDEDEGRLNFYEKVQTDPADLFEESLQPSAVHVENVSYEALDSKLTGMEDDETGPAVEQMGKTTCFNCDGNHTLRECPLPRDHKRINRSRNNMNNKTSNRYHLTVDNKYAKFKPGRLSDELRAALGLGKKSLPLHIYRMRVNGYPLAWLKEAEITESGLSMINTDKCAEKIKEGTNMNTVVYDLEKIIDYPGFNVKCGDDYIDESRRYGLPQMLENHSKEHFIRMLQQTAEFTKIQREDNEVKNNLTDLPDATDDDSEPQMVEKNHNMDTDNVLETTAPIDELERTFDAESCEKRSSAIKTMPGTPVLNPVSPFCTLPKGENFSVGVSDVIAFENLPDSTGKYEKMRGTISKVRKTLLKGMK